jgi:hypothetical protein
LDAVFAVVFAIVIVLVAKIAWGGTVMELTLDPVDAGASVGKERRQTPRLSIAMAAS